MTLTLRMERLGNRAHARKPRDVRLADTGEQNVGAAVAGSASSHRPIRIGAGTGVPRARPLEGLDFDADKTVGELRLAIANVLGIDATFSLFCSEDGAFIGRVWSVSVRVPLTFAMEADPDARKLGAVFQDRDMVEVAARTGMMLP